MLATACNKYLRCRTGALLAPTEGGNGLPPRPCGGHVGERHRGSEGGRGYPSRSCHVEPQMDKVLLQSEHPKTSMGMGITSKF